MNSMIVFGFGMLVGAVISLWTVVIYLVDKIEEEDHRPPMR